MKRVHTTDEHLIVERDGVPVAVLMSYQEYKKLLREQALIAFERFSREFGHDLEQRGVTPEQLLADLEKEKQEL